MSGLALGNRAWGLLHRFLGAWLTCLLLMAATPVAATAPSWQLTHCADPKAEQLEQALACPWQAEPPPRKSWGQGGRWMRLRVEAMAPTGPAAEQGLLLELRPHALSRIQVHQQMADGAWQMREAGSQLPGSQPFAVLGGYAFPLAPQPHEQVLYLRVKAQNVQAMGLVLQTVWQGERAVQGLGRVDIGVQIGLLAMVALLAVVSFVLHPRPVVGRFALSSVNMLLGMLSGSGLLALTWLQNSPELDIRLFDLLVCLRLSLWIWVSQALLQAYVPPAWFGRASAALHSTVALAAFVSIGGFQSASYALMVPAILLTPIVLAWAAWRTAGVPAGFRRVLVGGFVLTGGLLLLVVALALLPPWAFDWARYGAWLTDFCNPLVMLVLVVMQQRSQVAQLQGVQDQLMRARLESDFERRLSGERQVLIDMLVHELKNPLASIRLAMGSLFPSSQVQEPASARRLQNIRRSIDDMTQVLERCALMNSLDQVQADTHHRPVDLPALVRTLVEATAEPERFALELAPVTVHGHPELLRLVVSNLLDNALKYSPPASKVELTVQAGPRVQLRVTNAVEPDMQPDASKIFSRYYRHPLAQQVRGTGLGLFLVREICQKIGASIAYDAAMGRVQMTVDLPP